jgi:hypothetical protein
VAIVVSEETGSISLVSDGAIERGLQVDDLRIQLRALVLQRRSRSVERNLRHASTSGQSW